VSGFVVDFVSFESVVCAILDSVEAVIRGLVALRSAICKLVVLIAFILAVSFVIEDDKT